MEGFIRRFGAGYYGVCLRPARLRPREAARRPIVPRGHAGGHPVAMPRRRHRTTPAERRRSVLGGRRRRRQPTRRDAQPTIPDARRRDAAPDGMHPAAHRPPAASGSRENRHFQSSRPESRKSTAPAWPGGTRHVVVNGLARRFTPVDDIGRDQFVLGAEVRVQRSLGGTGLGEHAVDAYGAHAFLVEQTIGGIQQAVTHRCVRCRC